jgi:hypothetical protein
VGQAVQGLVEQARAETEAAGCGAIPSHEHTSYEHLRSKNAGLFNALGCALGFDASTIDASAPDCADGTRIRATRWLHPGYQGPFIKHSV